MFTLAKSGIYVPANETIMSVKEHDQSIQSGAYESVNVNNWWRTPEYGFYPKGFEKKALPLGDKIVYIANGVAETLDVPDVPVKLANGKTIGLRQVVGMGVIRLEKLQYDEDRHIVSVTSDFDPAKDVKVVDIMRPSGWALVDADGYPLKTQPSNENVPNARYSCVRHSYDLEKKSTGWHGSLDRVLDDNDFRRRVVGADTLWSVVSGVALVKSREAAAPRDVEILTPSGSGAYRTAELHSATVRVSGSVIEAAELEFAALSEHTKPEKLVALGQLLDSLAIKG